jgi:hypothetical protein
MRKRRPTVIRGSAPGLPVVCRAAGVLVGYRRHVREAGRYRPGPGAGEYSFAYRVCLAENVYPALILAAIEGHRLR